MGCGGRRESVCVADWSSVAFLEWCGPLALTVALS